MKVKKIIGLGLSVIMTAISCNLSFAGEVKLNEEISVVSDSVDLADSLNSFDRYITVKDGEFNDSLSIVIQPMGEVEMDSRITFELENGIFDEEAIDKATSGAGLDYYSYKSLGKQENYDYLKEEFKEYEADMGLEIAFVQVFYERMLAARTVNLPYKLRKISDREMEVSLFALPEVYVNETFAGVSKPKYKIPLPFKATGGGNVKMNINSVNTSIRGGIYTIAKTEGSDEEYTYSTGSKNSVNIKDSLDEYVTVEKGIFNDSLCLIIEPKFQVEMDSEIILKLENGVFDEEDMKNTSGQSVGLSKYDYKALEYYDSYDYLKNEFERLITDKEITSGMAFEQVFYDKMYAYRTVDLPYKLRKISDTEMEVTLFALPGVYAGERFAGVNKPIYRIPIPFTATGGDVSVSLKTEGTSISNSEHIIGKDAGSSVIPLELGDVDGNDGVTANDASLVLNYVLRKDTKGFAEGGLDMAKVTNGNKITALDAASILMKALDVTGDFVFEVELNRPQY